MPDLLKDFVIDARGGLAEAEHAIQRLAAAPHDEAMVATAFRAVHGIKGSSLFLPLPRTARVADAAETVLADALAGRPLDAPARAGLRDALGRLQLIVDALTTSGTEPSGDDSALVAALERLALRAPEPQDLPLPEVANRLVRRLSRDLGKPIHFLQSGLDGRPGALDHLREPLLHLLRHCAEHGLDDVPQRLAAGKPAAGRIVLHAARHGSQMVIELAVDGIDRADQHQHAGLDQVRADLARLHGTLAVHEAAGCGMRFTLTLPAAAVPHCDTPCVMQPTG